MSKHKQLSLTIDDRTRTATKSDGTKIPVLDAKYSCLIQPTDSDIRNSVKGDHANCMYCVACRRQYGSQLVWVTRTLAYVELKGRGGKPELRRFILEDPAKANIAAFDAGEEVKPEAVIFAAPRGARTLDKKAENFRKWYHKKKATKKEAYVKGEKMGAPKAKPESFFSALRDPARGMFQFKNPNPLTPGGDKK